MKTLKLKKLLVNKAKGAGDLIASMFVILALTLFVFFFINVIADVNTRIQMDQIARKYILRMESEGYLTAEEESSIKTELLSIPSVKAVTDESGISLDGSTKDPVGYGATLVLKIKCPAATTVYIGPSGQTEDTDGDGEADSSNDASAVGTLKRNKNTAKTYVITKSSTAKY